jgi:hypothetical protein
MANLLKQTIQRETKTNSNSISITRKTVEKLALRQRVALKTKRPKKSPVLMWKSKWQTTSHQTMTPEGTKKTEMKKYLVRVS